MSIKFPMKNFLTPFSILFVVAILLFFAGRWTSPRRQAPDNRVIDSLHRDIVRRDKLVKVANEQKEVYKAKAEELIRQAVEGQKPKIIYKHIRNEAVRRNLSYSDQQLDSAVRANYPDSLMATTVDAQR